MASKIVSAKRSGVSYWNVQLQDTKTNVIYQAFMHETEYNLKLFEYNVLGCVVSEEILENHRDLIHDAEYHDRCMEECD